MLYIPISALNLVSCRQAWVSGYAADRVGLALAAGDNFLKLATGAATAQAIYKAMRGGTALASMILDGARFGSRALRLAVKVGNLFGAVESGYSLYAAVDKGDEGAAWAFGAGAVFFSLGLVLAPFTGGLTGAVAGLFAGLGGLCGVLGAFLSSSELEGELRTGWYGLKCNRRYNYEGPDDEPLRLLRYACLVTVQNVNVRDPKAPYGRLAEIMVVLEKLKKLADAGNPLAQYNYGHYVKDYSYLEKAADNGLAKASNWLSKYYNSEETKYAAVLSLYYSLQRDISRGYKFSYEQYKKECWYRIHDQSIEFITYEEYQEQLDKVREWHKAHPYRYRYVHPMEILD